MLFVNVKIGISMVVNWLEYLYKVNYMFSLCCVFDVCIVIVVDVLLLKNEFILWLIEYIWNGI